jgi:hypothetical protein
MTGVDALGSNRTTNVSLFFAVLPRIFTERGLVCRRNPGPLPLRRAK